MSRYPSFADVGDTGFLRKECERERQDEHSGIVYWDLYEQVDNECRAEWEKEFGEESKMFPYRANATAIHAVVSEKMAKNNPHWKRIGVLLILL